MKQTIQLIRIFLLNLIKSPLLYSSFLLVLMNLIALLTPLKNAGKYFEMDISVGIFAFLFNEKLMSLSIMTGLLLLFANLPFKNDLQLYIISRSSIKKWFAAQAGYILIISMLYPVLLFLMMGLILWNQADLSQQWGKLLGTITYYPSILDEFSISLYPTNGIMSFYTPAQSILITLGMVMLVSLFVGVLILVFNFIYQGLGFAVYAVFIFLEFSLMFFPGYMIKYVSPLSWLSLERISLSFMDALPTFRYVIIFLLSGIFGGLLLMYGLIHVKSFKEKVVS